VPILVTAASGVDFSRFAVFFDGHLYLEIARSFPLPYPAEAWMYAGQAPGYPAAIWILHGLSGAQLDWGEAALLASWLGAASSAALFCVLAREVGTAPLWAGLLFAVGNPRWTSIGVSAHPEPLAMALLIGALIAHLRGRVGASMGMLAAAALFRFPAILVGGAFAFDLLVLRRERGLRTWLWLAFPLAVLGLWNAYLALRIPGFTSVWHSHAVLWRTSLSVPFAALLHPLRLDPLGWITYGTIALQTAAVVIGFRSSERRLWVLPMWVLLIAGFHLSLSSPLALHAFTRLSVLAWPAALLVAWRAVAPRVPNAAVGALCVLLGLISTGFAIRQNIDARSIQLRGQHWIGDAQRRIDDDEPKWYRLRNVPSPPSQDPERARP
jgi:hypothetical protein